MSSAQNLQDSVVGDTVDPATFRTTLGHYASGITIIGGHDGLEPVGFTCQSFYSVSVDPPLVSFSVMRSSSSYPRIRETGKFAVNVLSHQQLDVSNQFARKGTDKWAGINWSLTRNQNPVIADTLMWLDCDLHAEYEAGDHYMVVGRVNEMSPPEWHRGEPLLYFKGQYRHLNGTEPSYC
ncbi:MULTISPECIES: flavin reductase family protein [unclassified Streptomyces]|uniref:flavin reductase family protein n=1 Tax=unclassified Streptomyces TaxID=2593676 RepID=UPI00343C7F28